MNFKYKNNLEIEKKTRKPDDEKLNINKVIGFKKSDYDEICNYYDNDRNFNGLNAYIRYLIFKGLDVVKNG
ncbi:MAG: hypothetical protein OEY79_02345 [Anaplasmataceae bacterium]|nr:hypothetical protein [Candidatus Heimdallarchaeota archaeon]MDH5796365.1 hypothetical protein [Anaplasmataceae bacterium]